MPPPNTTQGTAIDLGSLPANVTQRVDEGGTTFDVWYKYTAVNGENYIGIWGWGGGTGDPFAEYAPLVTVFLDGAVPYLGNSSSTFPNRPIIIPVVPGTTYYFKFESISGNYTPSNLTISVVTGPSPLTAVPLGAIFVNDDGNNIVSGVGYGALFLSSIDGENNIYYRFKYPFPVGEGGDVLRTAKKYLFEDFANNQCILYDSQLAEEATCAVTRGSGQRIWIRANQDSSRFYTGRRSNSGVIANQINRVSSAGVVTEIATFTGGLGSLAVNDDETLIYVSGKSGSTGSEIDVYDVAGMSFSVYLAAVANFTVRDMLLLEDGTLLIYYVKSFAPRDIYIERRNAAGTLLNTYTISTGEDLPSIPMGYRLAFALDSPTSFWVWWHEPDPVTGDQGTSVFQNIRVSDGAVLATKRQVEYQDGTYSLAITANPTPRFGNSSSCPFVILIEALGTTPGGLLQITTVTPTKRDDTIRDGDGGTIDTAIVAFFKTYLMGG